MMAGRGVWVGALLNTTSVCTDGISIKQCGLVTSLELNKQLNKTKLS